MLRELLRRLRREDSGEPPTWTPPPGLPPLDVVLAANADLDKALAGRPWIEGRVGVDPMQTNILVNALATLLVQHMGIPSEMVDYYAALTENQAKGKLEEASRTAPASVRKIIVPGDR